MSSSDQERWNERYRAGAYAERQHASDFLVQQESKLLSLAGRTAADIACGRGRNSRYLARLGFSVDAYDVSDVALQLGAQDASSEHSPSGGEISWHERNLLADEFAVESTYDVIIMVRFVALSLLATLAEKLRPGGLLLVEEHLQYDGPEAVVGPRSGRFRVKSGELVSAVGQMDVMESFEGLVTDPDGARAAVARLVARSV
ncbi:MAG: methyltransferase domain-containing protein [Pseudomonadales bacterium]|nr:methyltransferase domain-containing protein [Pseudomonadales bacterium]